MARHPTVVPTPATFVAAPGECVLRSLTTVTVGSPEVLGSTEWFRQTLAGATGIALPAPVVGPGAPVGGLHVELGPVPAARVTRGLRADGAPLGGEASRLHITTDRATVTAPTAEGVHRALTTLVQLAAADGGVVGCGTMDDAPELAWRGLSLDVARTFVPVEQIERVVDMCALYKLNVLHLHLTDNESWRLRIDAWPRLTEVAASGVAASRPDGHYTQAQLRSIVDYARDRHVTVVPEIDLPGHSQAAITAYPELGAPGGGSPNLDPASPAVWRFVDDVVAEIAALVPSPYLHIGGDEAFGMADDVHAAFVDRMISVVRAHGKRVVGWQEICRAGVGPDEVVQHWIDFTLEELAGLGGGAEPAFVIPPEIMEGLVAHFATAADDLGRVAEKGARLLLSPTSHLYLDRPHGDGSTDPEQAAGRAHLGLSVYPPTSLQEMLEWDPWSAAPGVDPDAIAGVEAAMWCETVDTMDDLECLLLPRLAGVAEVAWSASRRAAWTDHRARLGAHARLWRGAGWSWYRADTVDWLD